MSAKPKYTKAHAKPVAEKLLSQGWTLRQEFRVAPDDEPYEYFFEWCRESDPPPIATSMSDTRILKQRPPENQISSADLAAIIVDGLIDVGIVQTKDASRAVEIATNKIDGRKDLGDY